MAARIHEATRGLRSSFSAANTARAFIAAYLPRSPLYFFRQVWVRMQVAFRVDFLRPRTVSCSSKHGLVTNFVQHPQTLLAQGGGESSSSSLNGGAGGIVAHFRGADL